MDQQAGPAPVRLKVRIVGASGKLGQYMVEHDALTNDDLVQQAPAIVGCRTPSALAHPVTGAGAR
jgi:hypothetical protein